MSDIQKVVRHDNETYEDAITDAIRAERCMCWKCSKLKPKQTDNCPVAQQLYDLCVMHEMATCVSRCALFSPKAQA